MLLIACMLISLSVRVWTRKGKVGLHDFFFKKKSTSLSGFVPPPVKKSGGDLHWLTAPGPGSGGTFLKLNVKKNRVLNLRFV